MHFDFSVEPGRIDKKEVQKLEKTNGLFRTLQLGYSRHLPIVIRPDDVLNTVGCIWSKYVVLKAEQFRYFFVKHADKKVLTYESGGTYSRKRLPEFMSGLISLVKDDQSSDHLSWLQMETTTTTDVDRFVRSAASLASQKEYYEFRVCLMCGFPSVDLLGTPEDWDAVEFAVQSMPTPDNEVRDWQARLLKTISGMRSGEEDFWQRCVTNQAFGSGPSDYDGWILDFNPIDEKGSWMYRMEDEDILDLTVDFEIKVDDNGRKFEVNIVAGSTGVCLVDGALAPRSMFSVQEDKNFLFWDRLSVMTMG